MKLWLSAALAILAASAAAAQTRDDLRGPTGHQSVKLPPGVKGATGGQSRSGASGPVRVRHHRQMRMRRHATR